MAPRGTYFAGDAFLDGLYSTYGNEPSTNEELAKIHAQLVATRSKLYGGLSKIEADRELRTLAEQVKMYKAARETAAKIAETRAKSSRVTSQNITDMKIALDNNDRALAIKLNAVSPAWDQAEKAGAAKSPGGPADVLAAAAALTDWMDPMTKRGLDESSTELAPTMNRLAMMAFRKNITEVTADEMVAALGASAPNSLRNDIARLTTAAQRRYGDLLATQKEVQTDKAKIDDIARRLAAGAPGSAQIAKEVGDIADKLEGQLGAIMGRSAADLEAQRELTVNRNSELTKIDRDIDLARSRAYGAGAESAETKIGRLMATPQFKQWAEGNGYKIGMYNVDEAGKLTMVPGQDDKAALRVFLYQMGRTDQKYGPLFADKSTGVLVRVTTQDPAQKAAIMTKYKGTDGSFYLDSEGALVKPGEAQDELARKGFVSSIEAARVGKATYLRLPDDSVLDAKTGKPATVPADTKFFPAYKAEGGKPARYLSPNDVRTPEQIQALAAERGIGYDDGSDPNERAALDAYAKSAPYQVADENTVRSSWTGVYTGYLDRPHARDTLEGRAGSSKISLDGGKVVIPGGQPATIEVVKARDPGLVAGVVRAYNKFMPEQHLEKLRQEGVGVDREDGMPMAERVKLGEEQLARFNYQEPAPPPAPTDVMTTTTTPGGETMTVALPVGSQAEDTAQREGRPVVPIERGPVAPAAAPTAPAVAAAPATAMPTTIKVKDEEGNIFEVGPDKIKLVRQPEGAKKSTKTEWSLSDPTAAEILKTLGKTGQPVTEETMPAPSALPRAGAKTTVTAPPETGPEVGARGSAAVVVPRKTKPTTDEEDVERYAAKRAAEQARTEKAKAEAPYVPKPIEAGERMPGQDRDLLPGLSAPSRLPAMLSILDSQELKEGRTGLTDAEVAKLKSLRERYMKVKGLVSPVDQKAPMGPQKPESARADLLKAQRLATGEMESEALSLLEDAKRRETRAAGTLKTPEPERTSGSTSVQAMRGQEALNAGRRVTPGGSGMVQTPYEEAIGAAESKTTPRKPLFDKTPTQEQAEAQASETLTRNREARLAPQPKPNPFSFFKRKRPSDRTPVAPELENME